MPRVGHGGPCGPFHLLRTGVEPRGVRTGWAKPRVIVGGGYTEGWMLEGCFLGASNVTVYLPH